jgi:hypothetical protein
MSEGRGELIKRIYEHCPANWPDVRQYTRCGEILERMELLGQRLRQYPLKKRLSTDRGYIRAINEFRLLKAQLTVLSIHEEKDRDLFKARAAVDHILMWKRDNPKYKATHTQLLMNFVLARYDTQELREIAERMTT